MFYILNESTNSEVVGAKSANLTLAKQAGLNVLDIFTIIDVQEAAKSLEKTIMAAREVLNLGEEDSIILRSSANCEDSSLCSFAGIFESRVVKNNKTEFKAGLLAISDQSTNIKLKNYCLSNNIKLKKVKIFVLVQKYKSFDISGVVFSSNPLTPENGVSVNVQKGQPNKTVEGGNVETLEIPYQNYWAESTIASKKQLITLVQATNKLRQHFKKNIDIEFGFIGNVLWILQVRPITHKNNERHLYLDSSNLQENFPEPILPLTYSILQQMYYETYYELLKHSGYSNNELYKHMGLFQNLLCNINGNVYYNIGNWYKMGNLLPRNNKNNSGLQGMIGGQIDSQTFDKPKKYSKIGKAKYILKTLYKYATFSFTIREYQNRVQTIIASYLFVDYKAFNLSELSVIWYKLSGEIDLYTYINAENDFLLMYVGQKFQDKYGQKKYLDLLQKISNNSKFSSLMQFEFAHLVDLYNQKNDSLTFTDTKLGFELKYTGRFVNDLNLAKKQPDLQSQIENTSKNNTVTYDVKKITKKKSNGFLGNQISKFLLNREQNRLYRSQIFAILRNLFDALEAQLISANMLKNKGDIQYFTHREIFEFINLNTVNQDLMGLLSIRKVQYSGISREYRSASGNLIDFACGNPNIFDKQPKKSKNSEVFYGTSCSMGKVKDTVTVYEKGNSEIFYKGILVVKNLDPGWTISLSRITGLVIEEGGVLSHGAIVAREMGIPAIIGIPNITKILRSGDEISINGNEGSLILINNAR
jgi:rifampicin phosphotransferase